MNLYYNQNYAKEQVKAILKKIHNGIGKCHFTIAKNENRQENIDFINEYNINSEKQRSVLMQIKIEDFCHSLQNTRLGFEHEVLYVFVPQVKLFSFDGKKEIVDVYTKFNLIDRPDGTYVVVISFHKLNKPIDYRFR